MNKPSAVSRQRSALKRLPAAVEFDAMCAAFQEAEATRDRLWKQLYQLARSQGAALKDAPKSRLLAGAAYEALASLATRTEVDQSKVGFATFLDRGYAAAFDSQTVYSLRHDWERWLAQDVIPRRRHQFRARVLACLRSKPVKRLTVRKRKSQPTRVAAGRRDRAERRAA